jgi:tetratricopeptide (TPR) repeat protein/DNA-binding XRE family transcriptional regulator
MEATVSGDLGSPAMTCSACGRDSRGCGCIPAGFWQRPEVARAVAELDMVQVVRSLRAHTRLTQDAIARLTGLDQSSISRRESGRPMRDRKKARVALERLGAPSMSSRQVTRVREQPVPPNSTSSIGSGAEGEKEEVRRLLAHAAQITVGVVPSRDSEAWPLPQFEALAPRPDRVAVTDVEQISAVTDVLRAADYRFGGGACRDAIIAHTCRARSLLTAPHAPGVEDRLHQTLADLHNLAGWTEFDIGSYSSARRHFAHALKHAHLAAEPSLEANVLYRMGRLHLHRGLHAEALRFFQLGQLAAQNSGCGVTVAMLHANEAWVYALTRQAHHATQALGRAYDEFVRADHAGTPRWARWFGEADLNAMVGVVNAALPDPSPQAYSQAVSTLTRSLALRGADMTRSRAFELSALATTHLVNGDSDAGLRVGFEAVEVARGLRSSRVVDRLTPLVHAARRVNRPEAADLAAQVATLR